MIGQTDTENSVMIAEIKDISIEDLNYREAYLYLFRATNDMTNALIRVVRRMLTVQLKTEAICIAEPLQANDVDTEEILKMIVEKVKQNIEKEK